MWGSPRLCAVAALLALAAGCGERRQQKAPTESAPIQFANLAPGVAYMGREVCRPCHFEQFATFAETGMGRSLYPMSPEVVVEDFAKTNEFVVEPAGLHYRVELRDGKAWQRQFLVDSKGREIAADEHQLTYVIGSNHHSRSYVLLRGDRWFQAPACWYPGEQRWDLCPGYEHANEHFTREISLMCLHCHNAHMVAAGGERNRFEEPVPHGIDCERCHGPGQVHVKRWTGGDTPTGGIDTTIVNPRRLPREERMEVCFQCHLGDSKATERVIRHGRDGARFLPGQRITETVMPFRYVEPTVADFGLSAQADRLLLSRCYKESGGRLECLTCHNPHVTVYHPERPADLFRQKCLGCHTPDKCTAPAAERAATPDLPDDCVRCHMREAEPDDQRYTTFTDHWIRRKIEVHERDERRNHEIEPVFPERYAALPPGERAYYRGRAASLLAGDLPRQMRGDLWAMAQASYREAIEAGFAEAEAWYYLGKIDRLSGRGREADAALRRSLELDPDHRDAAFAIGQRALAAGDVGRALALFTRLVERDPNNTMALAEAGRATALAGRPEEALALFDRGLAREPWSVTLHLNRGKVLGSLGRFPEALEEARTAARLDPDSPQVWEFYKGAHGAAGRPDDAREAQLILERLRGSPAEPVEEREETRMGG